MKTEMESMFELFARRFCFPECKNPPGNDSGGTSAVSLSGGYVSGSAGFMLKEPGQSRHCFQQKDSDHCAGAAGYGEDRYIEKSAGRGVQNPGGNGVGYQSADQGGSYEFTGRRGPDAAGVFIEDSREESTDHGPGKGKNGSAAHEVAEKR